MKRRLHKCSEPHYRILLVFFALNMIEYYAVNNNLAENKNDKQ